MSELVQHNLHAIQRRDGLPLTDDGDLLSFCVEMETGTGKTYVYIKTSHELQEQYGLSKFIIVVPSLAIREGVKKFFEMTHKHFQTHYNKSPIRRGLRLCVNPRKQGRNDHLRHSLHQAVRQRILRPEIIENEELMANLGINAVEVTKGVYDHVIYDSNTVERPFAIAHGNITTDQRFIKEVKTVVSK